MVIKHTFSVIKAFSVIENTKQEYKNLVVRVRVLCLPDT